MPIPPWRPCSPTFPSKRAQKRHEVLLLLRRQLDAEDEVEELHRVVEAQEPAVVQVRRGVPRAAGRGGVGWAVGGGPAAVAGSCPDKMARVRVVHLAVL